LLLAVDGQTIQLRSVAKSISLPEGAGNLPTLRIVWDLIGDLPDYGNAAKILRFENKNNPDRIGWNEIVVGRVSGINVFDSTAFGSGVTDELKAYPQETLSAPLAERTAEFSFTANALSSDARALRNRDGHQSAPIEKDKFAELISVPEITPTIILLGCSSPSASARCTRSRPDTAKRSSARISSAREARRNTLFFWD
jgi:hypothetical protein